MVVKRGPWHIKSGIGNQIYLDLITTNPFYVTIEWQTNYGPGGIAYIGTVKTNRWR